MNDALKAYTDGEATSAESKAVEASLESDAELREAKSQFEAISSVLRHETVEAAPVGFERTLMAMAEAEREARRPAWLPWIPRFAIAALICGVVAFPAFVMKPETAAKKTGDDSMFARADEPTMAVGSSVYAPDADQMRVNEKSLAVPPTAPGDAAMATSEARKRSAMSMYAPQDKIDVMPAQGLRNRGLTQEPPAMPKMGGRLSPGPVMPALPSNLEVLPPAGSSVPQATLAKVDLDGLEKAVRQAASSLKGQVVGVSKLTSEAGATGRTILVSLSPDDAPKFVERAKKLLGALGSVSDPMDSPSPRRVSFDAVAKSGTKTTAQMDRQSGPAQGDANPKKRIEELKAKREELLKEYYEDAKPVKEIDEEIAAEQKKIDASASRENPARKLVQVTLGGR